MSTMSTRWILALTATLFAMLFAILSLPNPASAAPVTASTGDSCLTCHEDLYYLHDSGKWYCISVHKDRCLGCHEGNAAVMKKEEAHLGLIAHPQKDNGAKCEECHTQQDTPARLVKFASAGGFDTVIAASSYTPSVEVAPGFPETPEAYPLIENWPWLTAAFVLFSLWLILVLGSPLKP